MVTLATTTGAVDRLRSRLFVATTKIPSQHESGLGTTSTATTTQIPASTKDAVVGEWTATGECVPFGGKSCGKGEITLERNCLQEATGNGKTCEQLGLKKTVDCHKTCAQPDVTDWGHPDTPEDTGPRKGWYDVTGQGVPNDYCRTVGSTKFFACQTHDEPYLKVDRGHVAFSAGPANRLIPFDVATIGRSCPTDYVMYIGSSDPDFRKSVANGFYSRCGARCVYDHRNPTRQGWWIGDKNKVTRIEDMRKHPCGTTFGGEMDAAVKRYEDLYDTKNAWVK